MEQENNLKKEEQGVFEGFIIPCEQPKLFDYKPKTDIEKATFWIIKSRGADYFSHLEERIKGEYYLLNKKLKKKGINDFSIFKDTVILEHYNYLRCN